MSQDTRRILVAVALLVAANAALYGLRAHWAARQKGAPPFPDLPAVVDGWQGVPERVPSEIYEYLAPDKLSSMVYRSGEETINAGAIYSRDWRSVHSPALCFTSEGWNLLQERERTIRIPQAGALPELPVQELLASDGRTHCAALYTFLTPGRATASWPVQCFRMAVSGRGRGGVLLLLTADVSHSPEETQEHLTKLLAELYLVFARTWDSGGGG